MTGEKIEATDALVTAYIKAGKVRDAQKAAKLRGKKLTVEEADELIKVLIQKNWIRGIMKIARELGVSPETIKDVLSFCIERGSTEQAQEAANLLGRELTIEEIDSLVYSNIERGGLPGISYAIKLGASTSVIDTAVSVLLSTAPQPSSLTRECQHKIHEVQAIAKLGASQKAIGDLVLYCVQGGFLDLASRMVRKLGASSTTIDALVNAYVEHEDYLTAFLTAKLGASREKIETLVKLFLQHGSLDYAQRAARLLERELTPEEIFSLSRAILS